MKAVRLHAFHSPPVVDQVSEPTIRGPLDVIVKVGRARTYPLADAADALADLDADRVCGRALLVP